MATLTHYQPLMGSWTSYLSTALNSLANNARVLGAAVNNNATPPSGGLPLIRFQLVLASLNPSAGGWVDIFMIDGDGTNFGRGSDTVEPGPHYHIERFYAEATGAAARNFYSRTWRPASNHFKLLLRNNMGVAFASTGNTLSYQLGAPTSRT